MLFRRPDHTLRAGMARMRGPVKEYRCVLVEGPIRIDGILEPEEWSGAPPIRDFVSCVDGEPGVERTEARVCWDQERLYVAFRCHDREIRSTFQNRDDPIYEEEVVEVFIDPDCDGRSYYEINVSPHNVVYDAYVINPTGTHSGISVDVGWNCKGLETATRIIRYRTEEEREGLIWTVEMAIPFKSLAEAPSAPPRDGDVWRLNLYRIERAPRYELISWSPTLRPSFHVPSAFGRILFKENRD